MNERAIDRFACYDMRSFRGDSSATERFVLVNGSGDIHVGDSLEELNLIATVAGLDVAPFVKVWDDTKDRGFVRGAWVPSGTGFWIDVQPGEKN